jgi:hypothetical protein
VVKVKIRGALFHCGRCRKDYSNPFGHICVSRMGRAAGRTTLKPSLSAKCPKCHKDMGNPLTHTCTTRTDFKRRTAAAKKDAAAAKRRANQHSYSGCRDKECRRLPCVAYKEATEEAYAEGYSNGHEDGHVVGYDAGYPDGVAACPLGHI